jgi:hypothetical protein
MRLLPLPAAAILAVAATAASDDVEFEAAWRAQALSFAKTLQPNMPASNLATLTASLATVDPSPPELHSVQRESPSFSASSSSAAFYVAAVPPCSDVNTGTSAAAAFCSVERGMAACRAASPSCDVLLLAGVHRLNSTLVVTPEDSGVTIRPADPAALPADVVLTGAQPVGGQGLWVHHCTVPGAGVSGSDLVVWSTAYALPGQAQVRCVDTRIGIQVGVRASPSQPLQQHLAPPASWFTHQQVSSRAHSRPGRHAACGRPPRHPCPLPERGPGD